MNFKSLARRTVAVLQEGFLTLLLKLGWRMRGGPSMPKFSAVILSYKRPGNIPHLLKNLLLCDFVDEIIVSNNNPDLDLRQWLRLTDPRIRVIQQKERQRAEVRFHIARDAKHDFLLFIDDDIFLNPWQTTRFCSLIASAPESPIGISGTLYRPDEAGGYQEDRFLRRTNAVTDAIHESYAATAKQISRYHELIRVLGIEYDVEKICDDVILSFSGKSRARVVDLGFILRCPTATESGIAVYQSNDDFTVKRNTLAGQLKAHTGF